LERICADLVEESDAAPLVAEIEEHTTVGMSDLLKSGLELFPAVAAKRAERLAREALGVEAHEDRFVTGHVTMYEGDDLGRVTEAEDVDLELAVPRR